MLRVYVILCLLFMLGWSCASNADVVTDWNNVVLNTIRTQNVTPPQASRALAIVQIAVYDAVDAIDLQYQPYHSGLTAQPNTSAEAAAASAAYNTLVSLYPSQKSVYDAALVESLSKIPDGQAKTNGIALGQSAAEQIITLRSNDNSNKVVPYTPSTDPGKWRPTPPNYAPALLPNWPEVTTFGLTSASQFRFGGPPALSSVEYANDVNETKSIGAINSTTRTADQTQIAYFWSDGSNTETPPGHWNTIAQIVAGQQGNTLLENARMFAALNIAMADAAIAAWDCKYYFNEWRPITAIREADSAGNPLVIQDPTWTPLLPTPPFPECVSGHSTFSGAAAEVLALFYGTDDISFTVGSDGLPGVYRSFNSFSEAANEAGISRIYGGIHFEFSNTSALQMGNSIGGWDYTNTLQPIPEPSTLALAMLSVVSALSLLKRRW